MHWHQQQGELVEWKLEVNNQKFRTEVRKTKNLLFKRDIRPMSDHMDLFQHFYRDWNEEKEIGSRTRRETRGPAGTPSQCMKERNWRQ